MEINKNILTNVKVVTVSTEITQETDEKQKVEETNQSSEFYEMSSDVSKLIASKMAYLFNGSKWLWIF